MDTNKIQEQFDLVAAQYDKNRKNFIPCFDAFYKDTTDFIAKSIQPPDTIIDLGAGTGLLSYYWYLHFPKSKYLLVDIAPDMLKIAKKRFFSIDNVQYIEQDYSTSLPLTSSSVIISALSIHHLEHSQKQNLFCAIYSALPKEGIFINYDQFCAGDKKINDWYSKYWQAGLFSSGLSKQDLSLWQQRQKLDRECSTQAQIQMLQTAGFSQVECVFLFQKFAVIMAIK